MKRMCIYVYISTNITESLLHSRNQHVKQLYLNKNKFKKIPFPHFFFPLTFYSQHKMSPASQREETTGEKLRQPPASSLSGPISQPPFPPLKPERAVLPLFRAVSPISSLDFVSFHQLRNCLCQPLPSHQYIIMLRMFYFENKSVVTASDCRVFPPLQRKCMSTSPFPFGLQEQVPSHFTEIIFAKVF